MENKFDVILEELYRLKLIQTSLEWYDGIPDDIWDEYIEDNYELIESNINVEQHRHYETSITVIKLYDRFLGISHISNIYSDNSSCKDMYHELEYFEMEEFTKVSYRQKK